jgi:hypothetical protein
MTRTRSISSLILAAGVVILVAGCGRFGRPREEITTRPKESTIDTKRFDPLDLPQDTTIVPLKSTSAGLAMMQHRAAEAKAGASRTGITAITGDSLYSQEFRVQLVTCGTYGEGRKALRVAEEIFDQPVYMDYDVPYFKVRVGDFTTRAQAEAYQKRAVAAGYSNAWVVAVTITTENAEPMYEKSPVSPPPINQPADSVNGGNH